MSDRPVTAEDLVWRVVRDARWRGVGYVSSGFVADVFACYVGFRIYYCAKLNHRYLRIQVEQENEHAFRNAFPEAERDPNYGTSHGLIMLRLPLPEAAKHARVA